MEKYYFKGLEKALNDGCYIIVSIDTMNFPNVYVERKNEDGNNETIAYAMGRNIHQILTVASKQIIDEFENNKDNEKNLNCENSLIDGVLKQEHYDLCFFKLANGEVLSTICKSGTLNNIPIMSIMTDDIKTGFEGLNTILQDYALNKNNNFSDYSKRQIDINLEFQTSLKSGKKI